jgi:large conductance mechanosensitive channel
MIVCDVVGAIHARLQPALLVINLGLIIGGIITFLITAAVVYFVFVAPMNAAKGRFAKEEVKDATAEELLAEIRDLLKDQKQG